MTVLQAGLIDAWRARRAEKRDNRLRASAEPRQTAVPVVVVDGGDDADALRGQMADLNDLLKRWHRWQIGFSPVPTCSADPMFRNVQSGKTWDSTSQVLRDELNSSTMESIDFQVGELPDEVPARPYRSAIYTIAKNLHAGGNVWLSKRLPEDAMERGIVYMEARNMLMRRLMTAGVM